MFCLKCFTHGVIFAMSSHLVWLQSQHIFMIIFTMLIIYIYISVLSSTAFTYSYVFIVASFELSECDRTLTSLCFLSQILSLQIICILLKLSNVFSASLLAEDTETNIKSVFNAKSFHLKPGEVGTTTRQSRHAWDVEQPPICCMTATCPSDVNRQGHLCNNTEPPLSL